MRRNLVGKKKPQQPKIRHVATFNRDAEALTGEDLKAIRDGNSDLPSSDAIHWEQIATGSTTQFRPREHMAIAGTFSALRSDTLSDSFPGLDSNNQGPGSIQYERSLKLYIPAIQGRLKSDYNDIDDAGGTAIIVDQAEGLRVTTSISFESPRVGFTGLTGAYTHDGYTATIGNALSASGQYFRVRIKLSNVTASGGTSAIFPYMDGDVISGVDPITADGVYTFYCRGANANPNFALQFGATGAFVEGTLEYCHIDLPLDDNYAYCFARSDNECARSSGMKLAVRANGATAECDVYSATVEAGYLRAVYSSLLLNTTHLYGRSADKRPGHDQYYCAQNGDTVNDGWFAIADMAMFPVEDAWGLLYANNPSIGADVDPTAEWFIGHEIQTASPTWLSDVADDIALGSYNEADAWYKECAVQTQTTVAAIVTPTWDNEWSRAYSTYALVARNATQEPDVWSYDTFANSPHANEPNGFTIDAWGIVLGAQWMAELNDVSDGNTLNSGTTEAFRGARGEIFTNGHNVEYAANNNGGEFNANYGSAVLGGFGARTGNVPRQFQWRRITYIAESPQLVDIDTSGLYTEDLNHWSHAGAVIGFIN